MAKAIISDLIKIFKSSVSAVLPENLIKRSVKYNNSTQILTVEGTNYELHNKNIYLVGAGKAVQNMASEIERILGSKIIHGIVSIPEGSSEVNKENKNIFYFEGAKNNLPDFNSLKTTEKIIDLVKPLNEKDLLLVLISGGGSALLCMPKKPITLTEKTNIIKNLTNKGADINELNTVRKRLSDVKGGNLALKAYPAQVVSLILSDVVGDPLDIIASAPTYFEEGDSLNANDIIKKFSLLDDLPESIKTVLKDTEENNVYPIHNVNNYIIGSNNLSINAAVNEANNLNYLPVALSNIVTGNVKDLAKKYCKLVLIYTRFFKGIIEDETLKSEILGLNIPGVNIGSVDNLQNKDVCIILGGETTVNVKGKGMGGRNQQLALEFSSEIHTLKDDFEGFNVYLLSAGTDGIDGPTDAAGAIGYLDLNSDSKAENLDINRFLDNNDSYNFYKQFKHGDLHVITGHTNTNVMDIHLIVIKRNQDTSFLYN